MTDKKKLEMLIKHFADGDRKVFADMLGVPANTVTTWIFRGGMTAKGRELVLEKLEGVSREWLLRDGEAMLEAQESHMQVKREDMVPYYDELPGTCGVGEQFEHPEFASDYIRIPGVHALASLPAEGDSMQPTIMDGDMVIVGNRISAQDIRHGNIYLICTREGQRMIKRIEKDNSSKGHIIALSDNPDYCPRVVRISLSSVLSIYPVKSIVREL